VRTDILDRKDEILAWIEEELTLTEISARLHCKIDTLKRYLKTMSIEYKGQQAKKGQQKGPNVYKDSSYYTYKGAPSIASAVLREKLIRDGIKDAKCEKCGNTHWLGIQLTLELHHKNGDHFDNELDNLEILCPNCHSIETTSAASYADQYKRRAEKARSREQYKEERAINTRLKKEALLQKANTEREAKLALGIRPDSLGRVSYNTVSENTWLERRDLILNSGVDLTKFGWKEQVQRKTGLTVRKLALTIKHFPEEFSGKVYIRN
jgi:5-methylcytosine-specific restriction endonuclease McrA